MSDSPASDRQPIIPAPSRPPLHVILSYLLGTWADTQVFSPDRRTPRSREDRS